MELITWFESLDFRITPNNSCFVHLRKIRKSPKVANLPNPDFAQEKHSN
jgi:hypothetical protein